MARFNPQLQSQGGAAGAVSTPDATTTFAETASGILGGVSDLMKVQGERQQELREIEQNSAVDSLAGKIADLQLQGASGSNVKVQQRIRQLTSEAMKNGYSRSLINQAMERSKKITEQSVVSFAQQEQEEREQAVQAERERIQGVQDAQDAVIQNAVYLPPQMQIELNKNGVPADPNELRKYTNAIEGSKASIKRRQELATLSDKESANLSQQMYKEYSPVLSNILQTEAYKLQEQGELSSQQGLITSIEKLDALRGQLDQTIAQLPNMEKSERDALRTDLDTGLQLIRDRWNRKATGVALEEQRGRLDDENAITQAQIIKLSMNNSPDIAASVALSAQGIQLPPASLDKVQADALDVATVFAGNPSASYNELNNQVKSVLGQPRNGDEEQVVQDTVKYLNDQRIRLLQPVQPVSDDQAESYKEMLVPYINPTTKQQRKGLFGNQKGWLTFLQSQSPEVVTNLASVYQDEQVQSGVINTAQQATVNYTQALFADNVLQRGVQGEGLVGPARTFSGLQDEGGLTSVDVSEAINIQRTDSGIELRFQEDINPNRQARTRLNNYNRMMNEQVKYLQNLDDVLGTNYAEQLQRSQMDALAQFLPAE